MGKDIFEEFDEIKVKLAKLTSDAEALAKISSNIDPKEVKEQKDKFKSMLPIRSQMDVMRPTVEAVKEAQKNPDVQEIIDRLDEIFKVK